MASKAIITHGSIIRYTPLKDQSRTFKVLSFTREGVSQLIANVQEIGNQQGRYNFYVADCVLVSEPSLKSMMTW